MGKSTSVFWRIRLLVILVVFCMAALSMRAGKLPGARGELNDLSASAIQVHHPVISNVLNDLILSNFVDSDPTHPAANQLEMLLGPEDANHEKIVLEFYVNAKSQLTLAAYIGHKQRQTFYQRPQILSVRDGVNPIDVSKNIVLTDQEISMNKNDLKALRDKINDAAGTYKYIIFRPRKEDNHIVFDLYYTKNYKTRPLSDISLGITTNPSPPKDAN
jgi:hypothetical protein